MKIDEEPFEYIVEELIEIEAETEVADVEEDTKQFDSQVVEDHETAPVTYSYELCPKTFGGLEI